MGAEKGSQVIEVPNEQPAVIEVWTMQFTDRQTGDAIQITFPRDVRDELVKMLTGGIVLAGGGFPSSGPHLADGSLGHGPKAS